MAEPEPRAQGSGQRPLLAASALLLLVAVAVTYGGTLRYGIFGHDSYPILIASRIQSVGDAVGTFTEVYMDGRFPQSFYRPLLNLSFALDYALWELTPRGYQASNLLSFAGCVLALFALARRLFGPGALLGPLAALLLFVFYPSHFESIPVLSRRHDALCCLFSALALRAALEPGALRSGRPRWITGAFTIAAIGIKEVGFLLPALLGAAVYLATPATGLSARARRALAAALPAAVAAGVMLAARFAVLGGMGGSEESGLARLVILPRVLQRLVLPLPRMGTGFAGPLLALGLVLSLAVGLVVLRRVPAELRRRARRVLQVGGVWLLGTALLTAYVGVNRPWQALFPLAGLCLMLGALTEVLVWTLARGRGPWRAAGGLALLPLAGMALWHASYSPLVRDYDQWEQATVRAREYLDALERQLERARDGELLRTRPIPLTASTRAGADPDDLVQKAAILETRSVRAWIELRFPGRRILAVHPKVKDPQPIPDGVVVALNIRGIGGG